nr:hypothetical protein [Tanacetum cinerariifolium]
MLFSAAAVRDHGYRIAFSDSGDVRFLSHFLIPSMYRWAAGRHPLRGEPPATGHSPVRRAPDVRGLWLEEYARECAAGNLSHVTVGRCPLDLGGMSAGNGNQARSITVNLSPNLARRSRRENTACAGLPHRHLIAPIMLGRIQPLIRALNQLPAVAAHLRHNGCQANADRQAGALAGGDVGDVHAGDGLAQLFCQQTCPAWRSIGQHEGKFFAAITGREVGRTAGVGADGLGDLTQRFIPFEMPKRIVVGFEIIHVDHQQRQLRLFANGAAPLQFQVFVEVSAVGQPGQAVGIHQALQHQVGVQQLLLADAQCTVGLIALQQGHVGARMITDARYQLDVVGQLDQIVIGAGRKRGALDQRVFLGREHDDRDVTGLGIGPVLAHQGQTIQTGHDQVL